jgi:hypothetical protein
LPQAFRRPGGAPRRDNKTGRGFRPARCLCGMISYCLVPVKSWTVTSEPFTLSVILVGEKVYLFLLNSFNKEAEPTVSFLRQLGHLLYLRSAAFRPLLTEGLAFSGPLTFSHLSFLNKIYHGAQTLAINLAIVQVIILKKIIKQAVTLRDRPLCQGLS